jgi:hypothetical protein
VTLYGTLIAFLLLFPWMLAAIGFAGAAVAPLQRNWAAARRRGFATSQPLSHQRKGPIGERRARDFKAPPRQGPLRKAA